MSIQRVALIFDNTVRPETTGLYCRRALGQLVEVEHFLPEEMDEIPRGRFDLYLQVDDGLNARLPDELRPSALWAIDTHIDFERSLATARAVDFVFAAQRDGAVRLRERGIDAVWLPLACDPELHCGQETEKRYDVAFVGNMLGAERQRLLQTIRQRHPNTFIGNRYYEAMSRVYSQAKAVFNRSVGHDVNMRVFEALAAGSLLVTNDLSQNGQSELFTDGVHLATYAGENELFEKLDGYLRHDNKRERIAEQGRIEVLSRHTYLHRMNRLLRIVERKLQDDTIDELTALSPLNWFSETDLPRKCVSACLLSWKRPENVRRIVSHLRQQPLIDDILVWNNDREERLDLSDFENVTVIDAERNEVTHGRFLCAQQVRHEIIYTQDDDCLVHNIGELYETFRLDPSRITHNLKLGHLLANSDNLFGSAHMALVGWGAFFHRDWVSTFDRYIERHGRDNLLRRKADRLFSVLLNRRHRSIPAAGEDLPGTADAEALSVRDDHLELTRQSVERALSLLATPETTNSNRQSNPKRQADQRQSPAANNEKGPSYFEHARPEILERIPSDAKRVLDVGCGAGRLGESLKARQPCEVWGIEREPEIAETAKTRLDRVLSADAESLNGRMNGTTFDCIVCGDVLEHLRHPQTFLVGAREWLSSNGKIVASLPNVRHHSVVRSLLEGNWTYESAGLLDDDHVRFFTRREVEKLFFRAGYAVENIAVVPGPGHAEWVQAGRPREVSVGGLQYRARDERDAEELFAYQYLVTAIPEQKQDYGRTSMVIVTHNQLPYTRTCVDSIRHVTDEPYELIFVDNASTDGTSDYLESIPGATVIRNETNRGFPAAANQAIEVARGEQVLLLNNDTVATTGWLWRMLQALHREKSIGLVGPLSGNVSGEQQIPVSYDDFSALDGFAWELSRTNRGELIETDRLVGFCLLIRRDVIDAIGGMDEQFGIGNFEDDDFCRRAAQAGFRAVIAKDAFVHHVGGATFRSSDVDFATLMKENRRKFEAKWSDNSPERTTIDVSGDPTPTNGRNRLRLDVAPRQGEGLRLKRADDVRVSLCMIVRDNAGTIRPALQSIKPWVDEMIVVDTGSTDRTADICRELGAQVYHFPWCDDFSAARNESLKYANGEWIFWMDSDDTIPKDCGRRLKELAAGQHPHDTLGYVMQVHCPGPGDSETPELTVVDHVKLFRNRPDLRFEHCIHEQILPAIRRAGGDVAFTEAYVVHSGSDHTLEGRERKLERDFRILRKDLAERPDHPFVLFNLGMTHADAGQHDEAISHLTRCLNVSQPNESHLRKAYALLVSSLSQAERHDEAWVSCSRGLELFADDKELLFRSAMLSHHFGRWEESEAAYLEVLNGTSDRYFSSLDPGIAGYKARHNLAILYGDSGNESKAEAEWRRVVEERPDYRAGWRGLGESLLTQKRMNEADDLGRHLMERIRGPLRTAGWILRAKVAMHRDDPETARDLLNAAIDENPGDAEAKHELARLLFERIDPVQAEPLLQSLTQLTPDDASVWHNLGTIRLQKQRNGEAAAAFEESLRLRPRSPETRRLLDAALSGSGRA